jgi:predicted XRE-type DNA-binding protein
LLQALQETIRERGWKQVETASRLDIDQANVSKLLAGQLAGFSVIDWFIFSRCWGKTWK